ncbi:MAG: hypothetical protein KDI23_01115 [Pseudomonadales bacterium]|nr:hypothetical protein [Pseudomonadales bacterium]
MIPVGTKRWISADELVQDSLRLARRVIDSGFAPTLLLGLWRGGAPIAVALHEALTYRGLHCEHLPLRTTLYAGIDRREPRTRIHGLGTLAEAGFDCRRVLLVDDVFDTGITIEHTLGALRQLPCTHEADIRVATVWRKPQRNRTALVPDFWLHETADWLVFPHEMCGLDLQEIRSHRPQVTVLFD